MCLAPGHTHSVNFLESILLYVWSVCVCAHCVFCNEMKWGLPFSFPISYSISSNTLFFSNLNSKLTVLSALFVT